LSSNGYASSSAFKSVEGQVKNITNRPIARVTAVTTWYTAAGEFVTAAEALIEYDPLLSGQTSPFTTIARTNPAMTKYVVEFKRLGGGTIRTKDSRKR